MKWCIERNILIFIYFVYFLDYKIVSTYGPRGINFESKNLVNYDWDFGFCNFEFQMFRHLKEMKRKVKKSSTNILILLLNFISGFKALLRGWSGFKDISKMPWKRNTFFVRVLRALRFCFRNRVRYSGGGSRIFDGISHPPWLLRSDQIRTTSERRRASRTYDFKRTIWNKRSK